MLFLLFLAADWPAWRGPDADGAAAGDPPVSWSATKNVAWKRELPGQGASTPIVAGGLVIVTAALDTKRKGEVPVIEPPEGADLSSPRWKRMTRPTGTWHEFLVLAFDAETGKERWRRKVAEKVPHEGKHDTHTYAAGSAVSDGKRVWASFGSFGTYCLTTGGKVLWERDLGRLQTRLGWGESVTPLLHGGRLYVAHDHEGPSALFCLDAATGKTLWKADRDEPSNWTTPAVAMVDGKAQVILPGTRKVRAYDAATGKELWQRPGLTVNAIPSAIVRDGVAYVMAGYRGSAGYALKLGAEPEVLWKLDRATPYVPSPLLSKDRLWFTSTNEPVLTTVDIRTGKPVIDRARLPGLRQLYASPTSAGGKVYVADRDGTTLVLKEGDKLEVLATNKLGEGIDASPVVVGKRLYLRGAKHLWCLEAK
ncbi:MAG: PQQ-binding-like beta-propeller repeat protein [Gemmataceae bacterium]|nr:PQQ-binding-like beta-propeller repeat protein [Gemmataceae bacterium]